MTEQHPAVTFLLAAHAESERWATAASDGEGWWVIAPRYADHRTVAEYVIEGERGPVVHVDVQEHDSEAHRAEALLIQSNSPRAVLARVAAERDVLAARAEAEATLGKALADPDQVHPADAGIYVGKLNALTFALKAIATGWGWTA
jgi:hypothetical protein